jgi:hypothetical protein
MVSANTVVSIVQAILLVNAAKNLITLGVAIYRNKDMMQFNRMGLLLGVALCELATIMITFGRFEYLAIYVSLIVPAEFLIARVYSAGRAWDAYENLVEKQLVKVNSKNWFMASLFLLGLGTILVLADTAATYITGTIMVLVSFVLWLVFLGHLRKAGTSSRLRSMFVVSILLILLIIAMGIVGLVLVRTVSQQVGVALADLTLIGLANLATQFEMADGGLIIVLAALVSVFRSMFIGLMGFTIVSACKKRPANQEMAGAVMDDDDRERTVTLHRRD